MQSNIRSNYEEDYTPPLTKKQGSASPAESRNLRTGRAPGAVAVPRAVRCGNRISRATVS